MPDRGSDPIVVEGADVARLIGAAPGDVVAFRFDRGWRQVPVQVDERAIVDYEAVRQDGQGSPFSHLAYTDPDTFAGPDPDPAVDADDEIAAMAMDAGGRRPVDAADPKSVQDRTRVELVITDPLGTGEPRYLYLFRSGGSLDPAAGRDYVDYDFRLLSGDYRSTFDFDGVGDNQGPPANPEDSLVSTEDYTQHLYSRWIGDGLGVRAGGASGVDILDGDKAQVSYGCGRAEVTFARGGGGYIANIDGPVRAIRSYIGANSGTYTQRDHVYYRSSEVTTTYLRVHPGISTITQFLDYSAAADGMTYRNSAQPLGVTIDGVPDPSLETGNSMGPQLTWEQVSGGQGTVTVINRALTNMPGVTIGSYYQDNLTPSTQQCTGYADAEAHGASGATVTNAGQNTDPTLGAAFDFTGTRTNYFSAPGGDAALAERRSAQVDAPLQVGLAGPPPRVPVTIRAPDVKRIRPSGRSKVLLRLTGNSDSPIAKTRVCGRANKALLHVFRCAKLENVKRGQTKKAAIFVNLRKAGREKGSVTLRLRAEIAGFRPARDSIELKPKR